MKKRLLTVFFLCIAVMSVFSETISGKVLSGGNTPVADATIVLLELDLIALSDESGFFSFEEVGEGEYTLLVIAAAMDERKFPVLSPSEDILLSLSPEVVEMDTIVVTADSGENGADVNEGVTEEELERLAPRADPFESLTQESGILTDLDNSGDRGGWTGTTGMTVRGRCPPYRFPRVAFP